MSTVPSAGVSGNTFPARVCWAESIGYFVQCGDDANADYFDWDGNPIDPDRLHLSWSGEPLFRRGRELGDVETVSDALAKLERYYSPEPYDIVHLADNEWSNVVMQQIAQEWFAKHPACEFVLVIEHAGWSLGFSRAGKIWSTANDMADMSDAYPLPTGGVGEVCRRGGGAA